MFKSNLMPHGEFKRGKNDFMSELSPKVSEVPFQDTIVPVTTYVNERTVHPIPPEITYDMFDVENLPSDAKRMQSSVIRTNFTEDLYNSYSALANSAITSIDEMRAAAVATEEPKPVEPVHVDSAS